MGQGESEKTHMLRSLIGTYEIWTAGRLTDRGTTGINALRMRVVTCWAFIRVHYPFHYTWPRIMSECGCAAYSAVVGPTATYHLGVEGVGPTATYHSGVEGVGCLGRKTFLDGTIDRSGHRGSLNYLDVNP